MCSKELGWENFYFFVICLAYMCRFTSKLVEFSVSFFGGLILTSPVIYLFGSWTKESLVDFHLAVIRPVKASESKISNPIYIVFRIKNERSFLGSDPLTRLIKAIAPLAQALVDGAHRCCFFPLGFLLLFLLQIPSYLPLSVGLIKSRHLG